MITSLKLLRVYKRNRDKAFFRIITKCIETAVKLQGKRVNPLSGEETGKIIHEYRKSGYEHLVSHRNPWYLYPDKTLRNYDSIDSTPLFLILVGEFYKYTKDQEFLQQILPSVGDAFFWINNYGHKRRDGLFLEYLLQRSDSYGGLVNQGWMDSPDSILISGESPKEPIALVEVQGYYFKALKLWASIYEKIDSEKSRDYQKKAQDLKKTFNELFLLKTEELNFFAQAIFGSKALILERRSSPGHCLWASYEEGGKFESIIDDKFIPDVVKRLMRPDLFLPGAGIRTLTTKSKFFNPLSYHNGSIWPFDNGLAAEGFNNFGFSNEAKKVRDAVLLAIKHFGTPVELYCANLDGALSEYKEEAGRHGTLVQAWTAATILDFTTDY